MEKQLKHILRTVLAVSLCIMLVQAAQAVEEPSVALLSEIMYDGEEITVGSEEADVPDILYQSAGQAITVSFEKKGDNNIWINLSTEPGYGPKDVGEYRVVLSWQQAGEAKRLEQSFSVLPYALQKRDFNGEKMVAPEVYQNEPVKKTVFLSSTSFLEETDGDFEFSYQNNQGPTSIGETASITIRGKNNCYGEVSFSFFIEIDPLLPTLLLPKGIFYARGTLGDTYRLVGDTTIYDGGVQAYWKDGEYKFAKEAIV